MSGMEAIVKEFLAESAENLDQLDQDLVVLEKNPDDVEVFSRIFRTIHTIKGTCGFLAFGMLEAVTHSGETLMARLRDGSLKLDAGIMSALLRMIDAVRAILSSIEATGSEGDGDYSALIAELEKLASDQKKKRQSGPDNPDNNDSKLKPSRTGSETAASDADAGTGEQPVKKSKTSRKAKRRPAGAKDKGQEEPTGGDSAMEIPGTISAPTSSSFGESSLRVDVTVLDRLMNLVGELVLARNEILRLARESDDSPLETASARLHGVTTQLQEAVMLTRMQPISLLWNKLPRFVRDLSRQFGKSVELKMEGQDTELDRAVIEAIQGSLLHLVRNAVDHGIELPDVRRNRGKPETGTIRLRASHEGGKVLIEVSDDGGGIDTGAVLGRALDAGLISENEANRLETPEIHALLFRPGFSTARAVTNVSGRGVGLDIVKNNIESIGGTVEVFSEPGMSTSFRLKIPLTLAIIPVLLVSVRRQRFAIPQATVVELVRLEADREGPGVEDLNGVPVFRLRDHLLPLLFLDEELGLNDVPRDDNGSVNIVVLQGDDNRFGLIVDDIEDSQEIVVKPPGRLIESLPYAGSTILGDGDVALILDILRLGMKAGVISDSKTHRDHEGDLDGDADAVERRRLLFLLGPADERMALDFSYVDRLEFVPVSKIQTVAGLPVIQYRNEILQLVWVDETLPERRTKTRKLSGLPELDAVQVIVCTIRGVRVGLIVYRILDIVDHDMAVVRPPTRDGVELCIVIRDRVTEVLDLEALVRLSDPEFFERMTEPSREGR